MGLDQTLWAQKYIGGYEFVSQEEQSQFKSIVDAVNAGDIVDPVHRLVSVRVTAIQWRKASQIHKWFVDNVQDGRDDCKSYWVAWQQLKELRDLCDEVLVTRDTSKLPLTKGCFFGSMEIDQWYWADIQQTVEGINRLLDIEGVKTPMQHGAPSWTFFYESSW
jgi:hypothetical protein